MRANLACGKNSAIWLLLGYLLLGFVPFLLQLGNEGMKLVREFEMTLTFIKLHAFSLGSNSYVEKRSRGRTTNRKKKQAGKRRMHIISWKT